MNQNNGTSDTDARIRTAGQLLADGRRRRALQELQSVLDLELSAQQSANAALLLMRAGDLDNALVAARRLIELLPDNVEAMSLAANILADVGEIEEAIVLAEKTAQALPEVADAHYNLGIYRSRAGETAAARSAFARAVELDPSHAFALEYLANLSAGDAGDALLPQIETCLAATPGGKPAQRAALLYAQGRLLEAKQDWAGAFAAFEAGAALMRRVSQTDLDFAERYVSELRQNFDAGFFAQAGAQRFPNERPIFIVGAPRSGTTLVESVFASHSDVVAGGETRLLGLATIDYGGFEQKDLARIRQAIDGGDNPWATMGAELVALHERRFGVSPRLTEKNLGHHFLLGVVAMIAAGAKIVYCTRDPVATAWSCFKTRFTTGNGWSYDFDSIGRYLRLYRELMQHWQAVLPGAPIVEIAYEDLVAEPATQIPALLEQAGLPMEAACLEPHKARMPVMTASVTQVREPIYSDANAAWRRYEQQLEPYLAAIVA
ncbi:MAG: sulfotransferase [Woeseiaceae bacterium]|nr:sulfotransferase [Woeseiaceae bacterium]